MSFKDFLSGVLPPLLFSGIEPLCNFGRGHYEEQFCEFISNLGFRVRRRCRLKDLISRALAALMVSGVKPFRQF